MIQTQITPLVMKEAVSLPPALTILATIIGGALFGLAGVLLATPLTVVVMVLVRKIYVEGVLGKTVDTSMGVASSAAAPGIGAPSKSDN